MLKITQKCRRRRGEGGAEQEEEEREEGEEREGRQQLWQQKEIEKRGRSGTSLAGQWLRLCASIAWGTGSIPGL